MARMSIDGVAWETPMSILQTDLKLLYQRSGNRCAFPGCRKLLDYPGSPPDDPLTLAEAAHIVARKPDGPRGAYPLPALERDKYPNLILLCEEHHHVVDNQPQTYTVERLRQMKDEHENLMLQATARAVDARGNGGPAREQTREMLHSTLLPVLRMPRYVYGATINSDDAAEQEVAKEIIHPPHGNRMLPFIVRGEVLYCFQNLFDGNGPFRNIVREQKIKRYLAEEWWADPDKSRWFVTLLNRSLNKLTGRKGLNLDKMHRRYYFMAKEKGVSMQVTYRPLNQSSTSRQVVWQPVTRKTGEPKSYWYHRAVSLRFHQVGKENWCMSIRPELHVTKDGVVPLSAELVGSRVTRKKARAFNYDLLGEVQFWRDFLSEGKPRIILSFDKGQYLALSTTLMHAEIEWPGIPEEHQMPFRNIEFTDDLFSWAEWAHIEEEYAEGDDRDDEDELSDDSGF